MNEGRIGIVICEILAQEMKFVLEQEKISNFEIISFKSDCRIKIPSWKEIASIIAEKKFDNLYIFGCKCIDFPKDIPNIHLFDDCIELLLPKTLLTYYHQQGFYILIPGMLRKWDENFAKWGFTFEQAQTYFQETMKQILLIDSNLDPESESKLRQISLMLKIPYQRIPIGLDYFKERIYRINQTEFQGIQQKTITQINDEFQKQRVDLNAQIAETALVFDTIFELSQNISEKDAIVRILNLFMGLFSPTKLYYLAITGEKINNIIPFSNQPIEQCQASTLEWQKQSADFIWLNNKQGFIIFIKNLNQKIGLIELNEFKFPQHVERYFNLALIIAKVVGLVISNCRAMDALNISNNQLLTIFENLESFVYVINHSGTQIIFENKYSKFHPYEILSNDHFQIVSKERDYESESQKSRIFEFFDPKVDRWFSFWRRQINWVDGNSVILLIGQDISKQKIREEERIRAQRLESIGLLAGGIAHDFNNILVIVLGFLSLIQLDLKDRPDILDYILETEKAINRAKILTSKLLIFAKGGTPVKKEEKIETIVKNVIEMNFTNSNLYWTLELGENLYHINVDAAQITQAIQSIVVRAKDNLPNGGKIYIEISNCNIPKENEMNLELGDYIQVAIKDNSNKLSEQERVSIFDPYGPSKYPNQKSPEINFNLAIAHSIINAHNGRILLLLDKEFNNNFTLFLPKYQEIPGQITQKHSKLPPTRENRIALIMDDESQIRQIMKKFLERMNYEVTTVERGEEAIEKYKELLKKYSGVDLTILDLIIPSGMDGKNTIKCLLEIDPNVKAIVISGYSNDPIMANYRDYGFVGVLQKPFNFENLKELIKKFEE